MGADLSGAVLSGAILSGAKLRDADLKGTVGLDKALRSKETVEISPPQDLHKGHDQ